MMYDTEALAHSFTVHPWYHIVSLPSLCYFRGDRYSLGTCFLNFLDGEVRYNEEKAISLGHPA